MVEGFVDSASAYEIILVLARAKPDESYRMEWDQALEVTATLISAVHRLRESSCNQSGVWKLT